ncbi:MAG TPA: TIGR03085 family metal-binding protein [Pseudonocardiaceae bacterium]|nr:TIGR03085 family metal-binding protein [Pseudonocardiaceae bacterium]
MGLASDERRALCELFDQVGPDAPTLCDGWLTRDLAAHLVLRDRRPDAAGGILIKALAQRTQRVQDSLAAKPWAELVELVRTGPPVWSPFGLPGLSDLVNGAEYFIHHEDVRRGQDGWEPRPPDAERDAALWRTAGMSGRMAYRRSPVGVVLRRPDGATATLRRGPSTVAIKGEPGELLLNVFGRNAARVEFDGDEKAVETVRGLERSF